MPGERMDRFETFMSGYRTLGHGARADSLADLAPECCCPECPTYNDCTEGAGERLYCLVGRSFGCVTEDLGCVCPGCAVHRELDLHYKDFCLKGPEAARRYEQSLP
jgi:hypothetical protein